MVWGRGGASSWIAKHQERESEVESGIILVLGERLALQVLSFVAVPYAWGCLTVRPWDARLGKAGFKLSAPIF